MTNTLDQDNLLISYNTTIKIKYINNLFLFYVLKGNNLP